jgi:hypothetical protein
MAWLTAYDPTERDGKVLLHYTLTDPRSGRGTELCMLPGEVRHGRVYALEYGPEISPSARGELTIERAD